jgi:hypothetical protein
MAEPVYAPTWPGGVLTMVWQDVPEAGPSAPAVVGDSPAAGRQHPLFSGAVGAYSPELQGETAVDSPAALIARLTSGDRGGS